MKIAVVFAALLSLGMAYAAGTASRHDVCGTDSDCMAGLECREIWSDCGGRKQCVCEDDDEAGDTDFVYVSAAGRCLSRLRFGQSCDHSAECSYGFGQCIASKCVCMAGQRCKNAKVNDDSCTRNDECSYFDAAEWAYLPGRCVGGKCGCPNEMDRSGNNCNRRSGPKRRNEQCQVNGYRNSMQCASGLLCKKCSGNDQYARCRSGQGMIHASVFGVVAMLWLSLQVAMGA